MNTTPRPRRRRLGPVVVLSPLGELDHGTTGDLTAEVHDVLRRTRSLVLDLSGVTFLDCHAVGVLLTLAREADRRGARLRVAALPPHAHAVFTALDLYPVLGGRLDAAGECRAALAHLARAHRTPGRGV